MLPDSKPEVEEAEPSAAMSEATSKSVSDRSSASAKVAHKVIRLQVDEELGRPAQSLVLSGFAAGVAICASPLGEAFIHMHLPHAKWTELIVTLGYTVGFVIVILGTLQLFTESTITAALPVATHPTLRNRGRLGRLWMLVSAANLAGTFAVAALMAYQVIISPEQLAAAIDVASSNLRHGPPATLLTAIPDGFLIASIAWILPNARGSEFWVIMVVTYVISLGGFSHVVAGSGEAWLQILTGRTRVC